MTRRVLVTGANGFVGRALVEQLAAWGCGEVLALTRQSPIHPVPGARYLTVGDMALPIDWQPLLAGVHTLVHTAGRVHVADGRTAGASDEFRRVNKEGTHALADKAVAMGVRRFIYISTIGVNGVQTNPGTPFSEADLPNPNNAYATSKLDAELGLQLLAESTGLEVVIIRAPLVYGPNAKGKFKLLVGAVKSGWPLPFGSIQNKRSLVSLGNLVDFIVTCANSPAAANQVFLVSDGHDVSISELVKGLASAAGVRARQIPVPKSILQLVGFVFGQSMAVQGLCGDLQINMSKARDLLGWSPPISFEDGLRRAIADDVEQ